MSRLYNFFMVIFSIFVLALFVVQVYLFIKSKQLAKATSETWTNTAFCGAHVCPPDFFTTIPKLPLITTFSQTFDIPTMKSCANLVSRIEYAAFKPPNPLFPDNQTRLGAFAYSNEPGMFVMITENNGIIWIAFKGTTTSLEWQRDFQYAQHTFSATKKQAEAPSQSSALMLRSVDNVQPKVHEGFLTIYQDLQPKILDVLKTQKSKNIYITGHSLGSGIATIAGVDLMNNHGYNCVIYNFASPRVGDPTFCELVHDSLPVYRIVNEEDVIPTFPLSVSPNMKDPSNPFLFSHCGTPYYFSVNQESLINNHMMSAYITGIESWGRKPAT